MTASCLALDGVTPRKLIAQSGLDPNIINPCVDNNAIASINMHYQTVTADDFFGLAWANNTLADHLVNTGYDAAFNSSIQGVSPGSLDPSMFDYAGVTANLQRFCPEMQVSDAQSVAQPFITSASLAGGLQSLQQYGLSSLFYNSAGVYEQIGARLNDAASGGSGLSKLDPIGPLDPRWDSRPVAGGPTLAGLDKLPHYQKYPKVINHLRRPPGYPAHLGSPTAPPHLQRAHLQRTQFAQAPFMQLLPEMMGLYNQYFCTKDNMMMYGFAAEAVVVTYFCFYGGLTGLICGPILTVIGFVWLTAHIAICGF